MPFRTLSQIITRKSKSIITRKNKATSMRVKIKSVFDKFNHLDDKFLSTHDRFKRCTYCNEPLVKDPWCNDKDKESWCKDCDPFKIIEGWTSGNPNVDEFIKDTMYKSRKQNHPRFLEWVPFDEFTSFRPIGKGGFAKVYTATWKNGKTEFRQTDEKNWIKKRPKPVQVVLKRLIGSQNISTQYLDELQAHYDLIPKTKSLELYGITKHPQTNDFVLIFEFVNLKSLRSILSTDFHKLLWKDKMIYLFDVIYELKNLHKLGTCHRNFHGGNILVSEFVKGHAIYLSDFGLTGPANKLESADNIYGILPYTAPEILNGRPYTLASDIYSFGVFMAELSSGKPPFHDKKHDFSLSLDICDGLCPGFGEGTPDFYKELACRCMSVDPDQRPTSNELYDVLRFWRYSFVLESYRNDKMHGYYGREIKEAFEKANEMIPGMSTAYKKNPEAVYTSRAFTLNSFFITLYLNEFK